MRTGTATQLSPIARKQRALAGLGFLGAAGSSVWSGPPVGEGAGKGAETGAMQGAALGTSIMPGIGTAIGAVVGAIGGAIAGAIGKQDPEIQNFSQAIALWQQNPDAIYKLANKYLVLAGFFDLTPQQAGKIRIYRKYGRMGEEPFTRDLTAQVYQAAQTGAIVPSDSAVSVYQKVILPWEDSWGFGPEPPNPHSDFMDRLLTGMIFDYVTGYGPGHWYSRSGPLPASFSSIPPFQFPVVAAAPTSPTVGAAPSVAAIPKTLQYGSLYTNERANLTAGVSPVTTAIGDAAGNIFELGPAIGNGTAPLYVNGTLAGSNANAATVAIHAGQAYLKPSPGTWGDGSTTYLYSNGSWGASSDPFVVNAAKTQAIPVPSTAPQQPTAPVTVLSTDGSTVTAPGTALKNANGQLLYFGAQASGDPNNSHGYPVWINGGQNGYLLGMLLVGGQVYGQNDTDWFQWTGSNWIRLSGPPQFGSASTSTTTAITTTPPATSTVTSAPTSTAVTVPAGFTLVGTANNLQAYLGPDGLYYSWSGTNMTPLTGTLVGMSGLAATVISGQVQTTTAPATSTVQSLPSVYSSQPDYSSYQPPITQRTQSQPVTTAPAASSTSAVPTWAWLGAGVAALYMVMGHRRGRA